MMFTPHLLVYVCAWSVTVACRRAGQLRLIGQFNADESGRRAFAAALQAFRGSPASVMVDGVDEDYRLEKLPHVLGSARREMLDRRLRQTTRNALFSAAWPQGRESAERRDDRYLFISLSKHDTLRLWLDLLHQHGVHLAELTVLPVVSHVFLQRIKAREPHVLMVSEQSGGLRLSYFERGHLRFSRFTAPENLSDGHAPDLGGEITKTDLYLNSQRLMPRDVQLSVYVLDPQNIHAGLCRTLSAENKSLLCHSVGAAMLASLLGVTETLLHSTPDMVHLALLGRARAAVNLAPAAYTRGYARLRLRHTLYSAAFGVLIAALASSAYLFFQKSDLDQQRFVLQGHIQQQANLYRAARMTLPELPASPENLRRAVETARALQDAPQPMSDFARVSRALELAPELAVLRLRWIDHDAADSPATPAAARQDPAGRLRAVYFDGEVTPFQGDYKSALASIERFAALLRSDPGVAEVRVLALPINTDPGATLDESQHSPSSAPGARFKLKLLMRPAR